jgi:hypothetical protein
MVFGSEVEQLAKEGNPASQYAFAFEEMLLNPNIVSEWLIISALQGHYKAAHYLKKLPTQSNSIAGDLKSSNANGEKKAITEKFILSFLCGSFMSTTKA